MRKFCFAKIDTHKIRKTVKEEETRNERSYIFIYRVPFAYLRMTRVVMII